ncbi:hypothetical protein GP486_007719 [Trichoglossum hirsutum]|uniref:NADP-dependent oxidoreductase domain-containing protein n=1 Tax=Trichoglossum hirsutum TaxID=265104 RepID=A0A9P8L6Q2_9PEZI|nr:hypothetical protein GP486_007719 [Trichoglossum hirsutum]
MSILYQLYASQQQAPAVPSQSAKHNARLATASVRSFPSEGATMTSTVRPSKQLRRQLHWDTSILTVLKVAYGNERELGVAIKESGVPRSELYVVTKVWKGVNDIPRAFKESLEKLGLEYVDLYLIHAPFFAASVRQLQSAWSSLEDIHGAGKALSIGVSNFLPHQLAIILQTAKVKPAINQVELHTYLQRPSLVQFQKEHDIALAAYAPLAPITSARPGPIDGTLARLSKKYNVGEAEVLLRWVIDQGFVAVTTSTKESRLKEYLRATTFSLTPEEVKELSDEGQKKHFRGFWKVIFAPDDRS